MKTSSWPAWVCSLFLAVAAFAAEPVEIVPGVHLLRGAFVPGQQPDGNSILFAAPDGLVVVDTGRHREHTQAILDFAAARKKPIRAVINTHWHLDHTGGNVMLRKEARIYATSAIDDALKTFLANYAKQLKEGSHDLALIRSGQLGPDEVISKSETRTFAGRPLELHVEQAATLGDIWILDKASGVLVAGDLITLPFPFLDTASPKGWSTALANLTATDFKVVIPGHGPPMTRKQLEQYRAAFDNLLACAASTRTTKECGDGWVADAGDLVAASDSEFAHQAIDYYVTNVLRK